jgi:putative flippase GtrA
MSQSSSGSAAPRPKVAAAGIAGAATTILIWILNSLLGVEVPPEVAAALATILAFLAGYFTPQQS